MKEATLLRTGVIGTAIAAVCCFTPVLVIVFGAAGLSAWLGYADYVLLPTLAFFVALTAYALYRRRHAAPRRTALLAAYVARLHRAARALPPRRTGPLRPDKTSETISNTRETR